MLILAGILFIKLNFPIFENEGLTKFEEINDTVHIFSNISSVSALKLYVEQGAKDKIIFEQNNTNPTTGVLVFDKQTPPFTEKYYLLKFNPVLHEMNLTLKAQNSSSIKITKIKRYTKVTIMKAAMLYIEELHKSDTPTINNSFILILVFLLILSVIVCICLMSEIYV